MTDILIAHPNFMVRNELMDIINKEMGDKTVKLVGNGSLIFSHVNLENVKVVVLSVFFDEISGLDILYLLKEKYDVEVIMVYDGSRHGREEAVSSFSYDAFDVIGLDMDDEKLVNIIKAAFSKSKKSGGVSNQRNDIDIKKEKDIVLLAGSTGSSSDIESVLKNLDEEINIPVVICIHMSPGFSSLFADRLNTLLEKEVKYVIGKTKLDNSIYICSGNQDNIFEEQEDEVYIVEKQSEKKDSPSIDRLFRTCSEIFGENVLSIVFSGMGKDGVIGARFVKSRGGNVIVEDESTSLIFGIGQYIIEQDDADYIIDVESIIELLREIFE